MPTFGPGVLQIGEVGSAIDVSCHVNSMKITPSKDEGDSTTKLCGTVKPGKITYTYALSGNLDIDSDTPNGLFALSQAAPGTQQPFTFTPDSATETTATGTVIIDPLEFGGEEFGEDMTSDIEFGLVGAPSYTYPDAPPEGVTARFQRVVVNGAGATPTVVAEPAPAAAKGAKTKAA